MIHENFFMLLVTTCEVESSFATLKIIKLIPQKLYIRQ